MKIHLVDGTFELFRAHFGSYKAQNADGMEIGAVRGLLRSLIFLLDEATHVAVAFDHVIESFRNDLFAGYKTGAGIEPELLAQFPVAEEASRALGLVTWPMEAFEADDALAAAAVRYAEDPRVEQVVVCSPDKDLCQVVRGQKIVTLDRIRRKLTDEAGVLEKFGVPPASIPDLLALVGDKADGVPGIPRWGMKSAATVLREYGRIEDIPLDADAWTVKVRGAARLAANLAEEREAALLYKTLTTARLDTPIEEPVDALAWQGADRERMDALIPVIGQTSALDRIRRWR